MVPKLCILVVCLVLVAEQTEAKRPRKKKGSEEDDYEGLSKLVGSLQERLNQMDAGETCSAGNVHFYFHGDHDGHDHDHDMHENDQHVHVHMHVDGHSSLGHDHDGEPHEHLAVCDMHDPSQNINGHVLFFQQSDEHHAAVKFNFESLGSASGSVNYAAHVHYAGDLRNGCDDLGPHYDPYDPDIDVADFGPITVTDGSEVDDEIKTTALTLFGDSSIVGRSVAIHSSDGTKLACCVIGWSKSDYTKDSGHAHMHGDNHDSHDHDVLHSHSHDHSAHMH